MKQEDKPQAEAGAQKGQAAPTGESKEAASTAGPSAAGATSTTGVNVVVDDAACNTRQDAEAIEAEEAGDDVADLPSVRTAGGPELLHSGSMGNDDHSHMLLQKSLPQVPMDVDLELRVRPGFGCRCTAVLFRCGGAEMFMVATWHRREGLPYLVSLISRILWVADNACSKS